MLKRTIFLLTCVFVTFMLSCNEQKNINNDSGERLSIFNNDTALHLINAVYFYKSKPFNGELKEAWQNNQPKSIQHITNGKQQGLSQTFYLNGNKESTRWYVNGEKDSVHTGWWENGNKKYEYHFKNGIYDGSFTEWYQSGKMIQDIMYANGKELYGKGWRENGKLYMNFVMKNGRRYGLNNSNLCYGLKSETMKE